MSKDLYSPRLHMRPWRHTDSIAQDAWPPFDDPSQVFWHIPRRLSLADAESTWNYEYDAGRYVWAVESRNGTLIGRVSLREVDRQMSSARLGISFGAPYVGKGLGTEALELFLTHCFGPLGFRRIVLDVAGSNRRAVHCYERLGFRYVDSDWRNPSERDDLRFLDDPEYQDILPFIRRGRHGTSVQFFEMELLDHEWQEHQGARRL